jgi:MoaA/NifB/PqqE/SkfB family radical SAM enzyme
MDKEFLADLTYRNLSVFLVNYVKKDPENNIDKLANLLNKYLAFKAGSFFKNDSDKKAFENSIENAKKTVISDPNLKEYFIKIFKQTSNSYLKGFLINLFIRSTLIGVPKRKNNEQKLGVKIPSTILIDPTEACNLRCKGCWAGKYDINVMPFELFDRILNEAKALGINFIVLSGGEPTMYSYLFHIASKHSDIAFMMFTNGTLIDERMVEYMLHTGNISPVISLEGWEEETDKRRGSGVFQKIMKSMDLLKENGIPFGYSVTATSQNYKELFSDDFVQFMINKGALYGWSFHYIPVGRQPDYSDMVTPEQRKWLAGRVKEIRKTYPLMLFDFWNDGELLQGCIAGGRHYFHITSNGNVEPCAFAHVKCDNINEKSLVEVLGNRVFRAYQKYQPISENYLRPCPIIDSPEVLRRIVEESDAVPSYEGVLNILQGEGAEFLDKLSAQWEKVSEGIWKERMQTAELGESRKKIRSN